MLFKRLSCKARLSRYLLLRKLSSPDNALLLNIKMVKLYARLGNYNKAIKYAEELFYQGERQDYYFILLNLYIMGNRYEKISALESKYTFSSQDNQNLIRHIDNLNDTLYDVDKISFIKSYVRSKGANPVLINVVGKGKRLNRKSAEEKDLLENQQLYIDERNEWSKKNTPPNYVKRLYSDGQKSKFNELFSYSAPMIKATKVSLSDFDNSLVSVRNGLRTTRYQPEKADRKVIFFGSSTTFSIGMSDDDTLVSNVQRQVNRSFGNVKLENHGVLGMNLLLAMNNLVQTNIQPDDIVVLFDFDEFNRVRDNEIFCIDLNNVERGRDFFLDLTKHQCHFSPRGNRVIAEIITNKILTPVLENKDMPSDNSVYIESNIPYVLEKFKYFLYKQTAQALETCEMNNYLELLDKHVPDKDKVIGSVAVNCNPITKGHMHLIDYASKQVDKLFIFVIEEDKSFFRFEDRLKLVTDSTRHLENVTVLPGGKFICTELTYPDYFDKETSKARADASVEAWFFCEYIARKLKISQIFLGDEPKCDITKQYNEKMQELLPQYDIDVHIIDRISTAGEVISASKVREYLKQKDFERIREIVPEPTYLFLKENY